MKNKHIKRYVVVVLFISALPFAVNYYSKSKQISKKRYNYAKCGGNMHQLSIIITKFCNDSSNLNFPKTTNTKKAFMEIMKHLGRSDEVQEWLSYYGCPDTYPKFGYVYVGDGIKFDEILEKEDELPLLFSPAESHTVLGCNLITLSGQKKFISQQECILLFEKILDDEEKGTSLYSPDAIEVIKLELSKRKKLKDRP